MGVRWDAEAVRECMDILRVAKKCLGRFYVLFQEQGISPGKYAVLMELLALEPHQSLQPSEIATRVGVKRPTVTGIHRWPGQTEPGSTEIQRI